MDLKERGLVGVDWLILAQDRDVWWALVNTVMNIRDTIKDGEFLDYLSVLSTSEGGLCSMESV
jgi:hypothetical protein